MSDQCQMHYILTLHQQVPGQMSWKVFVLNVQKVYMKVLYAVEVLNVEMHKSHKMSMIPVKTRNSLSCINQPSCLFECWAQVRHCRPACVLSLFSAFLLSLSALPLPSILLFQIPLLLVQFFTSILYVDGLK